MRFSRSLYRFRRRRRLGSPASCAAPTEAPVARTALQCLDDRLSSQPVIMSKVHGLRRAGAGRAPDLPRCRARSCSDSFSACSRLYQSPRLSELNDAILGCT